MSRQNRSIDWETIEEGEITRWYYTSKIMGYIIPGNFPYYTYVELHNMILNDPQFKKEGED